MDELIIGNFKPFAKLQRIPISPITLLYGQNNSGKSSIIDALQLLQALLCQNYSTEALDLKGIGGFKDFVHKHDTSKEVLIGFSKHGSEVRFYLDAMGSCRMEYSQDRGIMVVDYGGKSEIHFDHPKIGEILEKVFVAYIKGSRNSDVLQIAELDKRPTRLKLSDDEKRILFSQVLEFLRQTSGSIIWNKLKGRNDEYPSNENKLVSEIAYAFWKNLDHELNGLFYVTGKFLAEPNFFEPVRYIPSPGDIFRITSTKYGKPPIMNDHGWQCLPRDTEARKNVNRWLGQKRFDTGVQLMPFKKVKGGYKPRLWSYRQNIEVDFRNVGAGVSQVLPIILACFYDTFPESLLLIQQPELHLHPKLQAEISDLLIGALNQKRSSSVGIIAESHSEYLLLRLMRRIKRTSLGKETEFPISNEDVAINYVESNGDFSIVRRMPLNEHGQLIYDWPGGFFEEGLREVLL